jgi:hypothetical protein
MVARPKVSKESQYRTILIRAAGTAKRLELDILELVSVRAWNILGYDNFKVMWESEIGFEVPQAVRGIAVDCMVREGLNTLPTGGKGANRNMRETNGHTFVDLEMSLGFNRSAVGSMARQISEGVPPEKTISTWNTPRVQRNIEGNSTRKRPGHIRIGKGPNEFVNPGFNVRRTVSDDIAEIARQADVPKAEIYRAAIDEYLQRYRDTHQAHPVKRSYPKK